jgi:hypothetical protein
MLSIVINMFFPRETIVSALNKIGVRKDSLDECEVIEELEESDEE